MISVRATVVCDTEQRRTNAKAAVNHYADQHGVSSDPITNDVPAGKHGDGPTFQFMGWFGDDRVGADEAFDLIDGLALPWVRAGSELLQADGEQVVQHIIWQQNGVRTVLVADGVAQ